MFRASSAGPTGPLGRRTRSPHALVLAAAGSAAHLPNARPPRTPGRGRSSLVVMMIFLNVEAEVEFFFSLPNERTLPSTRLFLSLLPSHLASRRDVSLAAASISRWALTRTARTAVSSAGSSDIGRENAFCFFEESVFNRGKNEKKSTSIFVSCLQKKGGEHFSLLSLARVVNSLKEVNTGEKKANVRLQGWRGAWLRRKSTKSGGISLFLSSILPSP